MFFLLAVSNSRLNNGCYILVSSSKSVSTKLFIGNLPETIRRVDLLTEFEKFGKVAECDIVKDYAFVVSDELPKNQVAI